MVAIRKSFRKNGVPCGFPVDLDMQVCTAGALDQASAAHNRQSSKMPQEKSPVPDPSNVQGESVPLRSNVEGTPFPEQTIRNLRQVNHRYDSLIHTSPQLIAILLGEDMIVSVANEAILDSWGKGKDIFGKSLLAIMPEIIEQGFDKLLRQVYYTGLPFHANEMPVYLMRHGKKELMHYSFIYQAQRDMNGDIEGVAIIATEVTPQVELNRKIKESEAHFRQLAEFMSEKFSSADSEGNLVYCNKNWIDYTGLTEQELLAGGWHTVVHPHDLDLVSRNWHHSVKTGNTFEAEFRLLSKEGAYRWHLCRATAARDSHGNVIRWILITTEIQSQKDQREQLENAVIERTREIQKATDLLREKNEELRKMNQDLEAFTYISSHDLQEPLRKIRTFASRVLETEGSTLSTRGRHSFERILDSARYMQALIQDLLSYSRMNITSNQFRRSNLKHLLDEVKSSLRETIAEHKATITDNGLGEAVVIPFQFRQMLQNLIINSLKFSTPGSPAQIRIECQYGRGSEFQVEALNPSKHYVHLSVADNGIGFEPRYKEKIFEVFQRLHQKDTYSGTGIGLAIVKRIVDNHQGVVLATGVPSRGATFDIYLPVAIYRAAARQTLAG